MKTFITVLALFVTASAAPAQEMTPEMQKRIEAMQQNMGKMQECFANVDQSALQRLQAKAQEMEAEVRRLCAAGDRDGAQRKAMAYGIELSQDPELAKMRACGAGMRDAPMPGQLFPKSKAEQDSRKHICD